jgi:hypothetical protein
VFATLFFRLLSSDTNAPYGSLQTPEEEICTIESDFEVDSEGWAVIPDIHSIQPNQEGLLLLWNEKGGNPGGHIGHEDFEFNVAFACQAPAKYLGDLSSAEPYLSQIKNTSHRLLQ